jgi:coatomer subunit delta
MESSATTPSSSQRTPSHASVEPSRVCDVYQPLEALTVPITSNASHIVQDVYFAACIVAKKHAFEVLGVFDGMVGMGHKEPINLMQVRNVLEMGSRHSDNPASER